MLDIKKIKENPEAVKAGLRAKEVDCDATVDRILELDEQRRQLIASTEQRKAMQNKVSKEIPQMKKQGKDVAPLFAEMAELKAELAEDAAKLDAVLAEAGRCLTCGGKAVPAYTDDCMTCYTCEVRCPAGAVDVHPFKERLPRTLDTVRRETMHAAAAKEEKRA